MRTPRPSGIASRTRLANFTSSTGGLKTRFAIASRVGADEIRRMAAADARRLHTARGRKVRRAEADALHARARCADLLDVGDAECGLEDRVDEERASQLVARLQLREQPVDVVDVP